MLSSSPAIFSYAAANFWYERPDAVTASGSEDLSRASMLFGSVYCAGEPVGAVDRMGAE
ncbi:hypothetical protein [Actinoallomurus bryophytorum]|uniref:hypothetical protein n=1 Tax=Actinoallomurus bryophytorum TaxID=1490222 RepID=UPI00163A63B3|nr:hypothetical protein [Actinoallomurus bryophytorum]